VTEITFKFDPRVLLGTLDRSKEQIVPGHDSRYWVDFHLAFYRYCKPHASGDVLDLGCGYGYGAHLLSETAKSVVGIDYHSPAIEYAREHYAGENQAFREHDANNPLPFEDNSFDLIVSSEVLEHIALQKELLSEIARVGRPAGHAIIKTPQAKGETRSDNPHHAHELNRDEFQSLIKSVFPKAELFYWLQKCNIENRIIDLPIEPKIEKFEDPNPSDKAVLLYSVTAPTITPMDSSEDREGDLLAVCPIE